MAIYSRYRVVLSKIHLVSFFLLTLYLHYILNQGAESMIFKVFGKQCAKRTNQDWVSTVLNDLEEIGWDVIFADIQEMNKFKRKKHGNIAIVISNRHARIKSY